MDDLDPPPARALAIISDIFERGQKSRFDQLLRLQFGHWLQDNMLLRNDKMSMAHAIEGRVPFLDHELVEFAFRLPRKLRLRRMAFRCVQSKKPKRSSQRACY